MELRRRMPPRDRPDNAASIDRAMCTGFNWELGPFEMWDAVGVANSGVDAPTDHWYIEDSAIPLRSPRLPSRHRRNETRPAAKRHSHGCKLPQGQRSRPPDPGASLIDIGDDIACIELHSKKDAIGDDIVRLITQTFKPDSEAVRDFRGFVISGDAANFSVGANLMQLLLAAQEGEWDEVDLAVRAFQGMTAAIKFCPASGSRRTLRNVPWRRR